MLSVDEALTIVLKLASEIENYRAQDCGHDSSVETKEAIDLVTLYQLLNLRGKPFPLSTGVS